MQAIVYPGRLLPQTWYCCCWLLGDKLDVREGPQGIHVPGLRIEPVASMQVGGQSSSTAGCQSFVMMHDCTLHSNRAAMQGFVCKRCMS